MSGNGLSQKRMVIFFIAVVVALLLVTACEDANVAVTQGCPTLAPQYSLAPAGDSWVQACAQEMMRRGFDRTCAVRACTPRKILVAGDILFPAGWPHHVPSPAAIEVREALESGEAPGGVVYANSSAVVVLYRRGQSVYKFVYRLAADGLDFITNYQVTGGDAWAKAVNRAVRGDGMRKVTARAITKLLEGR